MCGINLIIDKTRRLDTSPIAGMNWSLSHRGPDHSAFLKYNFNDFNVFLGADRLKITSPEDSANQPMTSPDGNHALVFNGEIYNYRELKLLRQESPHRQSASDTDVLLNFLIENLCSNLDQLNGMFAFIYADHSTEKIVISRDRHGIKPLYWFEDENYYIASSEIRGILASGLVKKELNDAQIANYCFRRYPARPQTFYKNIYEFKPGTSLTFEAGKKVTQNFLPLKTPINIQEIYQDPVKHFDNLIRESVKNQIPADVPAGLFLSGGVDSTILLSYLNELGYAVKSYSISSTVSGSRHGTDDSIFIQKALRKLSTDNTTIEIDSSILSGFEEFIETVDQPVADTATWLTWLLCRKASSDVRCIFSGAGADELFAGYNRHKAFNTYLGIAPLSTSLLNKLAVFPEGLEIPFSKNFRLYNKYLSSIGNSPENTWQNFVSLNFDTSFFTNRSKPEQIKLNPDDYLTSALNWDRKNYLIQDVLKITDNASMAAGVEVRVPFLDNALASAASGLSAEFHLKNGCKWILKELLRKKGLKEFAARKKEGFGMPVGNWFREKDGQILLRYLEDEKLLIFRYINYSKVQLLLRDHKSGRYDYSAEIYSLVLLSAWLIKEFT